MKLPEWFWNTTHNLIAHPLLVTQTKWATQFHDWTASMAYSGKEKKPIIKYSSSCETTC